ncbi:MAG: chemotaxis protein CheB [Balneolaceae bacterium]|nr:chemotaxis protein CheB [Balneolaceae bacterium]
MSANSHHINVMIVAPSVLVRQMLSRILKGERNISDLYAMGNSENDTTLLEIEKRSPDLLFLSLDSVHSREIWLLKSIINMHPEIPVVLLTPLNSQGAQAALFGLKMGALDYITIPENNHGVVLAERHFRKRIVPLIKALPKINMRAGIGNQIFLSQTSSVSTQSKSTQKGPFELIVISGCLGGVQSLYELLSSLNDQIPVPVIIVQHMPKIYTREFAADLDLITPLNVREAEQNSILLPGQVYVAPGGFHTVIKNRGRRQVINKHRGPREMKFRPSIDVLLKSAVNFYQGRVLGVFLSGGGEDGVRGAEKLLAAGGEVLLESGKSSRIWDLPGNVQSIDSSIPQYHSHQLGREILKRIMRPKKSAKTAVHSKVPNH